MSLIDGLLDRIEQRDRRQVIALPAPAPEEQPDGRARRIEQLRDIERKRAQSGISIRRLERVAGLSEGTYRRLREPGIDPRADTIARLDHALRRLQLRPDATEDERLVDAIYALTVAICSLDAGETPEFVFSQPPARRANGDPEWRRAELVRSRALYLCNTCLGLKQTEIARAAGMTKQAVSLAMKRIEDARDEPATERMFSYFERAISG